MVIISWQGCHFAFSYAIVSSIQANSASYCYHFAAKQKLSIMMAPFSLYPIALHLNCSQVTAKAWSGARDEAHIL